MLFRGLKPAFAFQIAVNGTRLGTFIPLRKWLVEQTREHEVDPFFISLLAGSLSGMVGAAIGTPFQLIKTRMQAAASGAIRQPYRGLGHALASIVANEGRPPGMPPTCLPCACCLTPVPLSAPPVLRSSH